MIKKFHQFYLKQRFFPNWISVFINPFFFPRLSLLKAIKKFAPLLKGELLDFGCGAKPYESLFLNVSKYIGTDIENESHDHSNEIIDFYYDGTTLPFENESFDSIFSSEVLEHVPDMEKSLKELNRVLKRDGQILITVPFSFPEHEMPFDFRRLTSGGIQKVLTDHGFEIVKFQKYGSFSKVLFQLIIMYLHDLVYTKNRYVNLILNVFFIFPIQLISILFSLIMFQNKSLYFGTIILAQKNNS